ncbi:hypothetical protein PR202_ga30956 [Eleusine coracana subsp. coracana]|uniref:Polygalacturonase n=1 Tax=Eleusine coracana subsp. coracana TaxID=191504 RepID=A0AAV5DQH0_ELECO|nr:hypothetical protein PR202_ga30956 [Eleusine coracana subsp. coracana]
MARAEDICSRYTSMRRRPRPRRATAAPLPAPGAAPRLPRRPRLASSYLALTRSLPPAARALAALIAPRPDHHRDSCAGFYGGATSARAASASVEEFGAVGDGVTSNTAAFRRAVAALRERGGPGGARLEVPPGRWLTGSFNLTSRFTLFLHDGAVILGSQDPDEWPLIAPLPSYGRGRERLGPRHISLIHGEGLDDVVITDSSSEVCVEDCYIESGDDLVAVKSGWDQYGISVGKPSSNIVIQRVSGTTPTCSGVGFGSEMSGGISNVLVHDLDVWNSASAVRLKTDVGRGGYITNITIVNVMMEKVKVPIRFSRGADDHSDDKYDRSAMPRISNVLITDVVGVDLQRAPMLEAVHGAVYEGICFRNVSLRGIRRQDGWHCESVYGEAHEVFPAPCEELQKNGSSSWCGLF